MPGPDQNCAWCGGTLTQRSRFGSQRYGLEPLGLYACDSCIDQRAFEQPPNGWDSTDGTWSIDGSSQLTPGEYLVLGFGLALILTAIMAVDLAIEAHLWKVTGGLIGLYLIGAACAFVTPVRPRDHSKTQVLAVVGWGMGVMVVLRALNRVAESYPAVRVGLEVVFALGTGWAALLMIRYGFESRRQAQQAQIRSLRRIR